MHILDPDPNSIVRIYESPDPDPETDSDEFYSALDPSEEYWLPLNCPIYQYKQ